MFKTRRTHFMTHSILMIVTSHDHINAQRASGLWFEEFADPYAIFKAQGYQITVASPRGGQAPIDPNSLPKEADTPAHQEALAVLKSTLPLSALTAEDFDALFLPGGHGTMFDMPSAEVGSIVGQFADSDKIIAAVCHGPAGLVAAHRANGEPIVRGYRLTSFTNAEEDAANLTDAMPFLLQDKLIALGAQFVGQAMWSDHVVVDRKLITGQNPQSSSSTARALVALFENVQASV
jgi:putative intracellular protease/amidase